MLTDLRLATGFLTRIPVGPIRRPDPGLTGASGYFPLVGALVAGVGLVTWIAVDALLGPVVAAVAAVLATVAVTGAFHEDGLADSADGLWGGHTPERRLEIMRDSRLGTYGTAALVGDLALRMALLVPLDVVDVARVLVAGHVIGRAAPLLLVSWLPAARMDGVGIRAGGIGRRSALIAGVTVAATAPAVAGWWAPVIIAAAFVAVAGVRRAARRRIGGFTGDVLGAGVAVTHLVVAATVAALVKGGLL